MSKKLAFGGKIGYTSTKGNMFKNRSLTIGQLIQWTACGLFVSAIITAGFGILGYIFLTVTEDIGMIWLQRALNKKG